MEDGGAGAWLHRGQRPGGAQLLAVCECESRGQCYRRKEKGGWFTVHVNDQALWRPAPPPDMQTLYYEGLEAAQLAAEAELLSDCREIVRVFEAAEPAGDPAKRSAEICGND